MHEKDRLVLALIQRLYSQVSTLASQRGHHFTKDASNKELTRLEELICQEEDDEIPY